MRGPMSGLPQTPDVAMAFALFGAGPEPDHNPYLARKAHGKSSLEALARPSGKIPHNSGVVRVWSFNVSGGFSKQRAVDGRKSPKLRKLVPQRYVSCARNRAAS